MTLAEQKANPYLLLGWWSWRVRIIRKGFGIWVLGSGTVDVVGWAGEASLLGVYSLEGS